MEPDHEGVLRLEGGSTDDDLDSINGLFHCQMEDYELFHNCNVLTVEEGHSANEFPKEFTEIKEGDVPLDVTPAHTFSKEEPIRYNEATLQTMNLGDEAEPRNILVGDNWDPVLKAAAFKIFLEYKDVFAWTYKDLKGVLSELCVHRILLIEGAILVWKQPYRMNKNYVARVTEEINRMLEAGIIFKVQTSEWVSPIVISLWWPTVYNDAREWVVGCDTCQRAEQPLKRDFMPLYPSHAQELFERWGLDFIGPLKVSRTRRCRYIVVATEYLTKWVEACALPDNSAVSTTKFIYEQIFTRYGIPLRLTSDRGGHFLNHVI